MPPAEIPQPFDLESVIKEYGIQLPPEIRERFDGQDHIEEVVKIILEEIKKGARRISIIGSRATKDKDYRPNSSDLDLLVEIPNAGRKEFPYQESKGKEYFIGTKRPGPRNDIIRRDPRVLAQGIRNQDPKSLELTRNMILLWKKPPEVRQ